MVNSSYDEHDEFIKSFIRFNREMRRIKELTPEQLAAIPDKPRVYQDSEVCEKCKMWCHQTYNDEYLSMFDDITFTCSRCGHKWTKRADFAPKLPT